jgi:hypothetical protein
VVTIGYCIASFLGGALFALIIGLLIAGARREWIISEAKRRLL